MRYFTNEQIRSIFEQRVRLEQRIVALGGTIPRPWVHDADGTLRNLQLLELVEQLEKESRSRG